MISDRKADPFRVQEAIRRIEEAAVSHPLEKLICDMAVWWFKNQPRIADENIPKRVAFLEKTLEMYMEALALTVSRLQHAESHPSAQILKPRLELKGDLTRLD